MTCGAWFPCISSEWSITIVLERKEPLEARSESPEGKEERESGSEGERGRGRRCGRGRGRGRALRSKPISPFGMVSRNARTGTPRYRYDLSWEERSGIVSTESYQRRRKKIAAGY